MTDATGEPKSNTNQGDTDVNVWSEYEIETETSLAEDLEARRCFRGARQFW